jgi:hypothetical protein
MIRILVHRHVAQALLLVLAFMPALAAANACAGAERRCISLADSDTPCCSEYGKNACWLASLQASQISSLEGVFVSYVDDATLPKRHSDADISYDRQSSLPRYSRSPPARERPYILFCRLLN